MSYLPRVAFELPASLASRLVLSHQAACLDGEWPVSCLRVKVDLSPIYQACGAPELPVSSGPLRYLSVVPLSYLSRVPPPCNTCLWCP
jgi:hypothetical protein